MSQKLLHFTAEWCNPCKRMAPIIDEFISNYPEIEYVRINVDENPSVAIENGVMSIPNLVIIDGDIKKQHVGVANMDQLKTLFNK